jgi:hypothetical protein
MTQGEQDNTWGDITSDNLDKIEQSVAGRVNLVMASSNITLTTNNGGAGGSEQAVNMILDCTGAITANIQIIAPNVSKLYVVKNATTDGGGGPWTVGIKTAAGAVLDIPINETHLVWCDGANGFFKINALVSGTVALATNALQLGGVVAANYAQLALKNSWANPQIVTANQRTLTADAYTPSADTDGNIIIPQSEIGANPITINDPTGSPVDGQILTFQIEQHATTPVSIVWGTKFIFTDDTNLDLTQTADKVDIFTAQYSTNLDRWLVAGVALNFPRV